MWQWLTDLFKAKKPAVVVPLPVKDMPAPPMPKPEFFNNAVLVVLANEGGYSNIPEDAGGATNFGVTISDLKAWRHNPNLTPLDVKNMTVDEAKAIYKANYWTPVGLDLIDNYEIALSLFDQSVLRGPSRAIKRAQQVCNELLLIPIAVDGVLGDDTSKAINKMPIQFFLHRYWQRGEIEYVDIVLNNPSQSIFLKGWINRCHNTLSHILGIDKIRLLK